MQRSIGVVIQSWVVMKYNTDVVFVAFKRDQMLERTRREKEDVRRGEGNGLHVEAHYLAVTTSRRSRDKIKDDASDDVT